MAMEMSRETIYQNINCGTNDSDEWFLNRDEIIFIDKG